MWHLSMRDQHKEWIDLGDHANISAAALHILKLEREDVKPVASLFFQVYADPLRKNPTQTFCPASNFEVASLSTC